MQNGYLFVKMIISGIRHDGTAFLGMRRAGKDLSYYEETGDALEAYGYGCFGVGSRTDVFVIMAAGRDGLGEADFLRRIRADTKPGIRCGEKEEVWESSHSLDVGNRDQTVQMESLPWIFVHVAGAVHEPGVYQVETGTRVYQVIELAGGLTEEADQDFLNLAGSVEDGQKITVYTKAQVEAGETREVYRADSVDEQEKKVNLNTADKETLMTLSGIGEARAEAILAYREEQGGFQSIEEIMEISGIKTAAFEKIKDQITV